MCVASLPYTLTIKIMKFDLKYTSDSLDDNKLSPDDHTSEDAEVTDSSGDAKSLEAAEIHPSAVVSPSAELGHDVQIGPYCVIGPDVTLADNVKLHSHVVVDGVTTIGTGTEIFPFASIGSPTQDKKFKGGRPELLIGENNIIREHVTMNPSTEPDGKTLVGDNGLFMVGSHIAHDCIIGNNVIMANNATLGGHVEVGDFVVIGGLAAVHQFIRLGRGAIIGGMSGVENDVIPFGRVKGDRAYLAGLNFIGLERSGISKNRIKVLQKAFNQLFADGQTVDQRINDVAEAFGDDELVSTIIDFARNKNKFALCRPKKT